MKIYFLLLVLMLTGCARSSPVYLPDGQSGYALSCSGNILSWNSCYAKAGELCGARGYTIIQKDGEGGSVIGAAANRYQSRLYGSTTQSRTMTVQCNSSP